MSTVEDEVLVDLVRHGQQIVRSADFGDRRQLGSVEDLARRVVGGN